LQGREIQQFELIVAGGVSVADFLTKVQRSALMSKIRGRDTQPEVRLRKGLHRLGLRYRLHLRSLPGSPDLVLPKYKVVVFVHGCFWHHHLGCSVASNPKSNQEFWEQKFERNIARDKRVSEALEKLGWRVLVVWECQVNSAAKAQTTAAEVAAQIRKYE